MKLKMKNSKEKNHDWKSILYLWIKRSVIAHFKYLVAASIFVFVFAFVFALLFQSCYLSHTDVNSARYMLSALVQSQAAIVAIIITLTLIAVQLTASAYSPRVVDIFREALGMWILLGLYGTSIFYGLTVLRLVEGNKGELLSESVIWSLGHISISLEWCVSIAFWLGIITFVALAPYIWNITNLLKPENIITQLTTRITKNKKFNSNKDPIQPIVDIIRGSIRKYDFETTRVGLEAVTNRVISVIDLKCEEEISNSISNSFCTRLQGVGKLAASIKDEESTEEVIENLERFGKDTAEKTLEVATKQAIASLEVVGITATRKGTELEDAVKKAVQALETIGKTAIKYHNKVAEEAAKSLGTVGNAAANKELEDATREIISSLKTVGESAMDEEQRDVASQIVSSLRVVGETAANLGEKIQDLVRHAALTIGEVGKVAATKATVNGNFKTVAQVAKEALENILKIAEEKGLNEVIKGIKPSLKSLDQQLQNLKI